MADGNLRFTISEINDAIDEAIDYGNKKNTFALTSKLPTWTKTSKSNAFIFENCVSDNDLEINEIAGIGDQKLFYICGWINIKANEDSGIIIPANQWTHICTIKESNQQPTRAVPLLGITNYSTNVKLKLSVLSNALGHIDIWPDKDISNLTIYIQGFYRKGA